MIGSMILEQSSSYIRSRLGEQGGFSIKNAYLRTTAISFSTQMFNPSDRFNNGYNAHFTRYIGTILLPFLCLIPLYRWGRREKWLMTVLITVWLICLAPPFLLSLWKILPFMDRVIHFFYFYTHFGQIMLVLVAGLAMEKLFYERLNSTTKLRFTVVAYCIATIGAILFFSNAFPHINPRINARIAVLLLLTGILFLQALLFGTLRNRKRFVSLLIIVSLADTTHYFFETSLLEQKFTENRGWLSATVPLSLEVQSKLRDPWAFSEPLKDFDVNLFEKMPVSNDFWTRNGYVNHRWLQAREQQTQDFLSNEVYGRGLEFYKPSQVVVQSPQTGDLKALPSYPHVLLLQSRRARKLLEDFQSLDQENSANQFDYVWHDWKYNTFSFTVNSSQNGWLFIRQLYDPLWKFTVDGKSTQVVRANLFGMAFPIPKGQHEIRMDYRPFARSLY